MARKRFHLALTVVTFAQNNLSKENLEKLKKDFFDHISLTANLKTNELKKNITFYKEKYARLLKVQHQIPLQIKIVFQAHLN